MEIKPDTLEWEELPEEGKSEVIKDRLANYIQEELTSASTSVPEMENLKSLGVLVERRKPVDYEEEGEPWRIEVVPKVNSKEKAERCDLANFDNPILLEESKYKEAIRDYKKGVEEGILQSPELELVEGPNDPHYPHGWPEFDAYCRIK